MGGQGARLVRAWSPGAHLLLCDPCWPRAAWRQGLGSHLVQPLVVYMRKLRSREGWAPASQGGCPRCLSRGSSLEPHPTPLGSNDRARPLGLGSKAHCLWVIYPALGSAPVPSRDPGKEREAGRLAVSSAFITWWGPTPRGTVQLGPRTEEPCLPLPCHRFLSGPTAPAELLPAHRGRGLLSPAVQTGGGVRGVQVKATPPHPLGQGQPTCCTPTNSGTSPRGKGEGGPPWGRLTLGRRTSGNPLPLDVTSQQPCEVGGGGGRREPT